jgi:hypothetical protein
MGKRLLAEAGNMVSQSSASLIDLIIANFLRIHAL